MHLCNLQFWSLLNINQNKVIIEGEYEIKHKTEIQFETIPIYNMYVYKQAKGGRDPPGTICCCFYVGSMYALTKFREEDDRIARENLAG